MDDADAAAEHRCSARTSMWVSVTQKVPGFKGCGGLTRESLPISMFGYCGRFCNRMYGKHARDSSSGGGALYSRCECWHLSVGVAKGFRRWKPRLDTIYIIFV